MHYRRLRLTGKRWTSQSRAGTSGRQVCMTFAHMLALERFLQVGYGTGALETLNYA